MEYEEFLKQKDYVLESSGFDIEKSELNPRMFEFEKDIVRWALKKGMASKKIKITRCESGDWEILEYDGYRDSNHHIDYVDFLKHLGYEVEEIEITDEEMEEIC